MVPHVHPSSDKLTLLQLPYKHRKYTFSGKTTEMDIIQHIYTHTSNPNEDRWRIECIP
jgi:hypothetical protein